MRLTAVEPARLAAGRCVEIARDAAACDSSCPSLALLLWRCRAGRAAADKPAEQDALPRRPDGPLPARRHWLFRLDTADQGITQRCERQHVARPAGAASRCRTCGTSGDDSHGVDGAAASAGTARTSGCPSARRALEWAVRFESVNYRARVWLNGKPIGAQRRRLPPVRAPARTALKRRGTNRLVVRVDSRRQPTDFPPAGLQRRPACRPAAGGTTAGILREVYLRAARHGRLREGPRAAAARRARACAGARRRSTVDLRNVTRRGRARHASPARFGAQQRRPRHAGDRRRRRSRAFTDTHRGSRKPQLWSPAEPVPLRRHAARVRAGGAHGRRLRAAQRHPLDQVSDGRLLLNGQRLNFRGVGLHEDSQGAGLRDRQRVPRAAASTEAKAARRDADAHALPAAPVHAGAGRPLGPADLVGDPGLPRQDAVPRQAPAVRALAAKELEQNIDANQNHPSVLLWSIGNELSSQPGPGAGRLHQRARPSSRRRSTRRARSASRSPATRRSRCQARVRAARRDRHQRLLRLVPGPERQIFDRTQALRLPRRGARAATRSKALMVTEFGAEANRDGPVEEKGT